MLSGLSRAALFGISAAEAAQRLVLVLWQHALNKLFVGPAPRAEMQDLFGDPGGVLDGVCGGTGFLDASSGGKGPPPVQLANPGKLTCFLPNGGMIRAIPIQL